MSDGNIATTITCDLCVAGTGIAGLNALYAASRYLPDGARVAVVDRGRRAGGMWNDTYDYVRLHQPYEMFTAGGLAWSLDREPSYLATKREVLDHFDSCMAWFRTKFELVEYYGYRYLEHREVPVGQGYEARILCTGPVSEPPLEIRAQKFVKAFGFEIAQNEPLSLSSSRIRSVTPKHADLADSEGPIYIVGGGKTGMDTAYEILTRQPEREVHLVVGPGTVFLNRNQAFPKGLARWFRGTPTLRRSLDLARRFNGQNEEDVFRYFKKKYAVSLGEDFEQFVLGILSEEEHAVIARGVAGIEREYLEDIVDASDRTEMLFKSGRSLQIPPDSTVVNCTGHIFRVRQPYEPFVSEHGTVVSVQPTSAIHVLTSFSGYFLVHLAYQGLLKKLPLYELDYPELSSQNKMAAAFVGTTHTLYNTMIVMGAVPSGVMRDCRLDFDRWFPTYRRLLGVMHLKRHGERYVEEFRAVLDRVRDRYGVHCGVLG